MPAPVRKFSLSLDVWAVVLVAGAGAAGASSGADQVREPGRPPTKDRTFTSATTASTTLCRCRSRSSRTAKKRTNGGLLGLLPGIALLAVVGYAGKFIEQSIAHYGKAHHKILPNIEYVLWAILIGVVIANTVGLPKIFPRRSCNLRVLAEGGHHPARRTLHPGRRAAPERDLVRADLHVELALALTFMTYLGRGFNLLAQAGDASGGGLERLRSFGDHRDAGCDRRGRRGLFTVAIAAILALGAISLVFFPVVGHALHMSDHAYGLVDRTRGRQHGRGDGGGRACTPTRRASLRCWRRPAATRASASWCWGMRCTGRARGRRR